MTFYKWQLKSIEPYLICFNCSDFQTQHVFWWGEGYAYFISKVNNEKREERENDMFGNILLNRKNPFLNRKVTIMSAVSKLKTRQVININKLLNKTLASDYNVDVKPKKPADKK